MAKGSKERAAGPQISSWKEGLSHVMGSASTWKEVTIAGQLSARLTRQEESHKFQLHVVTLDQTAVDSPQRETYTFLDYNPTKVEVTVRFADPKLLTTGVSTKGLNLPTGTKSKTLNSTNLDDRNDVENLVAFIKKVFAPGKGKKITEA